MKAILELPEARQRVKRWTVEAYERFTELGLLEKNIELIRGILVEKMPKSPLHCFTSKAIYDHFSGVIPAGMVVRLESPLRLKDSVPEPDVAVIRGGMRDFRAKHPTTAALVVEVAVSSPSLDRELADLYAEAGVEEYWIVLPEQRCVEVYRHAQAGVYTVKVVSEAPAVLRSSSVPEISVDLADLFREQ